MEQELLVELPELLGFAQGETGATFELVYVLAVCLVLQPPEYFHQKLDHPQQAVRYVGHFRKMLDIGMDKAHKLTQLHPLDNIQVKVMSTDLNEILILLEHTAFGSLVEVGVSALELFEISDVGSLAYLGLA